MSEPKMKRHQKIVDYFEQEYGQLGSVLAGWQAFSRDVGVPEGKSITQCKKFLKAVDVNIVDFVAAKKNGTAVYQFKSRAALAEYIRGNRNKRFPLGKAKEDSFLKSLLIHLV
ncbi:unnamed protein product [Cercospora beticola]|nr:unnamed protein product [Cercospora beticola]